MEYTCGVCGGKVGAYYADGGAITVIPCVTCLTKNYGQGYLSGKEDVIEHTIEFLKGQT